MIERLTEKDLDGILSLQQLASFSDGWGENAWKSSLSSSNFFAFGKRVNVKLIGYVAITLAVDSCDIELVLVDKNFRRQSIASSLIEYAENFAKTLGVRDVFIEVREGNQSARALYKKHNYDQINVRKRYYSDQEDAIILKKEI